jgi:hypothetical protein
MVVSIVAAPVVLGEAADSAARGAWGAMENTSRTLMATPEGLLHLFLEGVSVVSLARAFQTDTEMVENSLRESMRKRDAINRASASSAVERLHTIGDAA